MASVETIAVGRETGLNSTPAPAWKVEVDRTTQPEWCAMLDRFDDANLYQTWSYGAVRWGAKSLSHLALKRNGEVVAMAQLRIVRPTSLKFGMAYLRWGPLCARRGAQLDGEIFCRMAEALREEYVGKRKLFLRILPNAFLGSPRAEEFHSAFSSFSQEPATPENLYRTFVLDLSPPLAQLRKNLDGKWRNMLVQSEKKGLTVNARNGAAEYQSFRRMYEQMWNRKKFKTTVDVEEFGRIQQDLPPAHRMQVLICEQAGVPVAGIVASAMGNSAIYLLGATSDEGLKAKGAYLLQWTLMQWLKENRIQWYDLGGIDPEQNPGVYHFKKGLSGADVSQLAPFVACDSVLSSTVVRAGLAANRALRSLNALRAPAAHKRAVGEK